MPGIYGHSKCIALMGPGVFELRFLPPVDFHVHTLWTDGNNSVLEMYRQACQYKLKAILFSEHARRDSVDWFYMFAKEVRLLPKEPCSAFVGVETRTVDYHGNINVNRDILSLCDLVVGSVHRFPGNSEDPLPFSSISPEEALSREFRLMESLLDNPDIDIIGHPFGMCLSRFGITPPKEMVLQLIEKAAKNNVAFEINSKYHSNFWDLIDWCNDAGACISLGSDAHSIGELGQIVYQLRKGKNR